LIIIADLLPLFCSVNLLLKFVVVVDVLFIDVDDDDDWSIFLPLEEEEEEEEEQDLKDATRVVVTVDDKIMGDNIFFCVVVSFMCVCDVWCLLLRGVEMTFRCCLCAFLKQKESKTTKTKKKQQEQKRGERLA